LRAHDVFHHAESTGPSERQFPEERGATARPQPQDQKPTDGRGVTQEIVVNS
jgi:hypothetical protein